ncbi:hypothetical protein ACUWC3_28545, partial [Klebsiella pneumoniae]|uniref:hypothetical protein n=1 Tax=Klebsiella pneumoniae TaxID=573 RepID=UPI00405554DE
GLIPAAVSIDKNDIHGSNSFVCIDGLTSNVCDRLQYLVNLFQHRARRGGSAGGENRSVEMFTFSDFVMDGKVILSSVFKIILEKL